LAKEELWKLKYFTMPTYNLQKNPLKEIQNPSPYYKLIIFWQKKNYENSNISPIDQLDDKHMDKQNKDSRLKLVCRPKIKLPLNSTTKSFILELLGQCLCVPLHATGSGVF
jgi:hypothetical protein